MVTICTVQYVINEISVVDFSYSESFGSHQFKVTDSVIHVYILSKP